MFNSIRMAFLGLIVLLFFACKKEKVIKNEDNFIEQTEKFSELNVETVAAGPQFIELKWTAVSNTHFKGITYSVFVDDQKMVDGLTTTKYSLINLRADQEYAVKIIALADDGKQVQQVIKTKTLSSATGGSKGTLYQEYKIHSYSTFAGVTSFKKCSDGGHLFARFLQHPNYFGETAFKTVVFKIDKNGHMLWYRLLPASGNNNIDLYQISIGLHNQEKEAIVFLSGYAFKIDAGNGDIILEKDMSSILNGQFVKSVFYDTPEQIIVGTGKGSLLSLNPQNLSVNWHQANSSRSGTIAKINMDSKKNIYYIFQSHSDQHYKIRVHKCDPNGAFLTEFLFDGTLKNEYNWGFMMNTLLVDEQDNLYLFGHNSDYAFLRYFKFGSDGTLLKKNEQSDYLLAQDAFFNQKGEVVLTGRVDAGGLATYGGIYVFDKDMNLKSKRFYTEIPYHGFSGVTGNPDGSYNIFLHYMQTYTYANSNFVFIKTDVDGKI